MITPKTLTEETQNVLNLIKKGLKNPIPWSFNVNNNEVAAKFDISNYVIPIPKSKQFEEILKPIIEASNNPKGLKLLMEAHGIIEGFNVGTRAFRNNNPGNLAFSNLLSQKFGALLEPPNHKGERRFAYFPTLEKGIAGKADYIVRISKGQHTSYPKDSSKTTLEVYIYKYAPPKENNTEQYLNNIIRYFKEKGVEISRHSLLKDIIDLK